jgi:hypothetical protein
MRRSFRTLRLCAIPGVSPRAGIRCPVGALRTPHPAERDRSAASLGSEHQNPSRTARKPNPPLSFLSERRTVPAEPPIRPAERDRSAASLGGEHQNPQRAARKPNPPQSLLSERRTDPAEPTHKYAQRSGIGPERALEAITKIPRATRESPILPRASSASAGPIPRSAPYSWDCPAQPNPLVLGP